MKKIILIFTFLIFIIASCGDDKAKNRAVVADTLDKKESKATPGISMDVLSDIVKSIPSPLEISFLIKDLGVKYDKQLLNSTERISSYNTNFKQALNLGIYSTDLGYANIYGQTQDALLYLNAIKEMAEGLNIGQFFDFNTIKKLATSSGNLDSLLLVTNTNLERINEHLQQKNRADLTILILTGGWLEALFLTCEVAKKQSSELLNTRIGEQKIILDQLLLLLSFYEERNANIKELINDLNELQKIYDNVKISYQYEEATTEEVNGIIVIKGNTESKVNFSPKDLESIHRVSSSIRKKVVGG
ncbi:MAG: hypothetical protein NZ551_05310 [Microscillaceae bacterium]|nr:hypothetical protein [Microscillaceae bacterium]MDW8460613.1 hypothetical protein [Cytophagales bacterium]